MLKLITFDGVSVTRDRRPVAALQNRRQSIALLLILAARGTRGVSRDEAIELFWPDGAVRDPRHSLDQLLSVTRAAAGELSLGNRAGVLRLDPNEVRSDVEEFEAARDAGRFEELAALYRVPFADGLSVGASRPLEQFLDGQRARFARDHAAALRTLAMRAAARDDPSDAARWWQALHLTDRLDAPVALELIASLAAASRSGEALRIATGYAALLRTEYGREHADVARWIRQLEAVRTGVHPPVPDATPPTVASVSSGETRSDRLLRRPLDGRYRLERPLRTGRIVSSYLGVDGTGEFGTVEVHVLEEVVAARAPAQQFIDTFRRVVALGHPNILPTFAAGVDGTLRYLVTARRPDETLESRLARERPLPVGEALAIGIDAASALAHAHARGVRHGDLRPRHIALARGRVCLYGFGLAESVASASQDQGDSAMLTLGSVVYHSPEQIEMGDSRADLRSDVYAFGCVLYEMLAGEPPFGGPSRPNKLLKLTQAPVPLRELRDTVPNSIAQIIHQCLARIPADRYASAAPLITALIEAQTGASASIVSA